jgi:hypothetical protein
VTDLPVLLQHLKTVAEQATPGPWRVGEHIDMTEHNEPDRVYGVTLGEDDFIETDGGFYGPRWANAVFISLADPDVVKALAEVAEAAAQTTPGFSDGTGFPNPPVAQALARLEDTLRNKEGL